MSKIDRIQEKIFDQIQAKYWDFPKVPDEMRIISYDSRDNPTLIEYYRSNRLLFSHVLTYDAQGNLLTKQLVMP